MKHSLTAIVLAIALMAPGTALGQALYDCAMSGTVSTACCCPTQDAGEPSEAGRFEAACCTVQTAPAALGAPARLEAQRFEPGPVAVALAPAALAPSPPPAATPAAAANEIRGPPTAAVPIFVRLCSFLI